MEIRADGSLLSLHRSFSMEIEETNPIFNDQGSQSASVTVPATPGNLIVLRAPGRPDAGRNPNNPTRSALVVDGVRMRRGRMNVTEASSAGITFNIGFDNSEAYEAWSDRRLSDLKVDGLFPYYRPLARPEGDEVDWLLADLYSVYRSADSRNTDFAVFPLAVDSSDSSAEDSREVTHFWEIVNVAASGSLRQPASVRREIDGEWTDVTIPKGYGVTPFLRVWKVLEIVFADLGVSIESNPFREDLDLSRLVMLNNAVDSCVTGTLYYKDLMPDVSVGEFLNSLWVRFGLVYDVDMQSGSVRLRFLRDILRTAPAYNFRNFETGRARVVYESPKYVRLSAATSIEGAAPATERFEDFVKGLDVESVAIGGRVGAWQNTGTQSEPEWDGDVGDDWWDLPDPEDPDFPDPEWPDPDDDLQVEPEPDDRDDGRDDDRDERRSAPAMFAARASGPELPPETILARETETGVWYKLDAVNGRTKKSSSSFFNWDPAPEGIEALDLVSADECVPVREISNRGAGMGNEFSGICPLYLFAARNYHTYIKGSDDDREEGVETPLAFLFAYQTGGATIGRVNAEGRNGEMLVLDDGSRPSLSLLFQFRDGLFYRFWREYDEILRHGNRSFEDSPALPRHIVDRFDMLSPVLFGGVRCLIDTATYSVPARNVVPVDLVLRPIQTQGDYDIEKEQGVPKFAAAARHLEWFAWDSQFGRGLDSPETRAQAVAAFVEYSDYSPHGSASDRYFVDDRSAVLTSVEPYGATWENDPDLPSPQVARTVWTPQYMAVLFYDVYEIHETPSGIYHGDKLGSITVHVNYKVLLRSRWVADPDPSSVL